MLAVRLFCNCNAIDGDLGQREDGLDHVHGDRGDPAGLGGEVEGEDAVTGLDFHRVAAVRFVVVGDLATQRMPLPHISASEPSALNMRMRTAATLAG